MNNLLATFGEQIIVERFTNEPTIVDGVITPGPSILLDIAAIVQDTTGRQVKNLTDSQRASSLIHVATKEKLFIATTRTKKGLSVVTSGSVPVTSGGVQVVAASGESDNTTPRASDIVHYEDERYEVIQVKKGKSINHFESICARIEE